MPTDGRESCPRFATSSRVRLSKTRSLLIDVCYRCVAARPRAYEEGREAFRFPASAPVNPGPGRCESRTSPSAKPGAEHTEADARRKGPATVCARERFCERRTCRNRPAGGVYGQRRRANSVRVVGRRTVGPRRRTSDVRRPTPNGRRRTSGGRRPTDGARWDGPANGVRVRTGRRPGRATPRGRSRAPRRSAPAAAPRPCTPAPRPR